MEEHDEENALIREDEGNDDEAGFDPHPSQWTLASNVGTGPSPMLTRRARWLKEQQQQKQQLLESQPIESANDFSGLEAMLETQPVVPVPETNPPVDEDDDEDEDEARAKRFKRTIDRATIVHNQLCAFLVAAQAAAFAMDSSSDEEEDVKPSLDLSF